METSRPDFITYITKHNDKKAGVSDAEIVAQSATLVLAGSETTATLLSGATYQLLRNPVALGKLTEEIRTSFVTEGDIDFHRVSELDYLNACLEEGLRCYPPVPVGLPRIVPEGGDVIAGEYIPGNVSINR